MASDIDVSINITSDSLRRVLKAIDELPTRVQGKILRPALRAGTKVIHHEIVATAPVGGRKWITKKGKGKTGGLLRASLKVRAMKRKRGLIGVQVATSRQTFVGAGGMGKHEVFYPPFVEFGHGIGKRSLGLKRGQYHLKRGNITALGDILKTFTRGRKRGKFELIDNRERVEGLHFMEEAGRRKAREAASAVEFTARRMLTSVMQGSIPVGDA